MKKKMGMCILEVMGSLLGLDRGLSNGSGRNGGIDRGKVREVRRRGSSVWVWLPYDVKIASSRRLEPELAAYLRYLSRRGSRKTRGLDFVLLVLHLRRAFSSTDYLLGTSIRSWSSA